MTQAHGHTGLCVWDVVDSGVEPYVVPYDPEDDDVEVFLVYARAACARSQTLFLTSASHAVSRMHELSAVVSAGSTESVVVVEQPDDLS